MGKSIEEFRKIHANSAKSILYFCDLLGFKPTWQQKQVLLAVQNGHRQIAVKSGQGPGKCICSATSFWYNATLGIRDDFAAYTERKQKMGVSLNSSGDQVFQTVLEDGSETFLVPSMTERSEKIALHKATAFPSGRKQCVRLRLDSGQWLDLSTDHPVYTARGWVHAENLLTTDLVATPRKLPPPENPLDICDQEVRFVGAILCDGGVSQNSVRFTHLPNDFLKLFRKDVAFLGGLTALSPIVSKAITLNVSNMLPITRKWGIQGFLSKEKRIPAKFYGLSDRQLGVFLNTVFSCAGYVDRDGFAMGSASEALIQDMQTLLLRAGVLSRYAFKAAKCEGDYFPSWRLSVSGIDNIKRLVSFMGLPVGRELQTKAMLASLDKEGNTNVDIVPIQTEQFKEMTDELGIVSRRGLRKKAEGHTLISLRSKFRARNTNYWSRKKMGDFCEETGYSGKYSRLADNDLFWAKVESVTPIGEHEVFDMNVPDTGTFVANNIVIHNTACSVVIGLWRAFCDHQALTIITAPTMRQCRDVWLKEARLWMSSAHPLLQMFIKITLSKIEMGGDPDWGVKLVTSTKEENAQGMHQKKLTVIAEEASGIPREIVEQFQGTLSNPDSLFLMIGNPNTRDCAFFDCFHRQRHRWHCITLNAEDTARDYPHIVSPRRNLLLAEQFGTDSDVYRVRVLGQFPHTDANSILSSEEVEPVLARSDDDIYRHINTERDAKCGGGVARQFGVDFARFGGDENVVFRRSGNSIIEWWRASHTEPITAVNKAFEMQYSAGWNDEETWFVPDANGMGEGMMDNFYKAEKNVVEFKNQGSAVDSQEYGNIITEAWFHFRNLVRAKNCCIPNDNQLVQQLCGRQYGVNPKGKLVIESKDDYKKRNEGKSPDRADALVMAFYDRVNSVGNITRPEGGSKKIGIKMRGVR